MIFVLSFMFSVVKWLFFSTLTVKSTLQDQVIVLSHLLLKVIVHLFGLDSPHIPVQYPSPESKDVVLFFI